MNARDTQTEARRQQVLDDWATDETASAWQKRYPALRSQFAQLTRALVDAANPRPGERVLDLASGPGEPVLTLAERVSPGGEVVATDISAPMLSALRTNADVEGLRNVSTHVADAQELPFGDGEFDVVTSRFGAMFFVDIEKALSEVRRVLKPGGRLALMVWGPPAPGTYFADTAGPFVRRLAVPPDPDGPGPMRFAESGKLANEIRTAGFEQIAEQTYTFPVPWEGSPEDFLASVQEMAAPFRKLIASLKDEDRRTAFAEALEGMHSRYDGKVTRTNAPVLILTANKAI